jgi:hypothetical protein
VEIATPDARIAIYRRRKLGHAHITGSAHELVGPDYYGGASCLSSISWSDGFIGQELHQLFSATQELIQLKDKSKCRKPISSAVHPITVINVARHHLRFVPIADVSRSSK